MNQARDTPLLSEEVHSSQIDFAGGSLSSWMYPPRSETACLRFLAMHFRNVSPTHRGGFPSHAILGTSMK